MDISHILNIDISTNKSIKESIESLPTQKYELLLLSHSWYDGIYNNSDGVPIDEYEAMEAYTQFFEDVSIEISKLLNKKPKIYDSENFDKKLEALPEHAEFVYAWEENKVYLTYDHQDHELPIVISLQRI